MKSDRLSERTDTLWDQLSEMKVADVLKSPRATDLLLRTLTLLQRRNYSSEASQALTNGVARSQVDSSRERFENRLGGQDKARVRENGVVAEEADSGFPVGHSRDLAGVRSAQTYTESEQSYNDVQWSHDASHRATNQARAKQVPEHYELKKTTYDENDRREVNRRVPKENTKSAPEKSIDGILKSIQHILK